MSLKPEKDKIKQLQDKCQSVLNSLLRDEDNKYCVDCDSKGPRWASWNIGVFLCIRCAGIHRNLGVHISKVKSVNLDSWTPEQVVSLQQMGNSRARAVYEANLPDNFRRPQNDSSLEQFIRGKYEHKKYIAREWVPPVLPKVNWEKEIDEEIEKQKRKKKTTLENNKKIPFVNNVEVPQLPKPTNPSPKPVRSSSKTVSSESKERQKTTIKSSKDFLNGDDNFSGFISAPPSAQNIISTNVLAASVTEDSKKKIENLDSGKSEEESFFNQTLPVEKEKVKLDKDSILALYANAPTVPQFQVPFPANGGFQSAQVPVPSQVPTNFGFGVFPSQGGHQAQRFPLQNGINNMPNQFFPQSNVGYQNWSIQQYPQVAQNQNQFSSNQFNQLNQFQNGPQLSSVNSQFSGGFSAFPNNAQNNQQFGKLVSSNPVVGLVGNSGIANNSGFYSMNQSATTSQPALQQQFGNLTLGGTTSTPASNTWQ